ncbi:MAG: hypothetical protein IT204_17825 [Fimbriimonadaceae bacterium]|nr:hypothetical protein [Fimbriimonadaceae bacterium]
MRWALLISLLTLATVATAAPPKKGVSYQQLAEQYYRRGRQAETLSDAAYRNWARSLKVGSFDASTDRWLVAVDCYSNAVRFNPAHWRAQQRLGILFSQARGTHAHDTLALLHLVAYSALQPGDIGTIKAKELADERLRGIMARRERHKIRGEIIVDPVRVVAMGIEQAKDEYLIAARELTDAAKQQTELAAYTSTLPGLFAEQINFNAELAKRILERNAVAATAAGGGASGPGAPGASGPMPAGGGSAGPPVEGGASGGAGGAAAGGSVVQVTPTRSVAETYVDLAYAAGYVPDCLAMISGMHRFMTYLDQHRVAYDPRLPEMLIGECMVHLRGLFTRGKVAGAEAFRQEYGRWAGAGPVTMADAWSLYDYAKERPEFLVASGQVLKPDLDEKFYNEAAKELTLRMPRYMPGEHEEVIRRFALLVGNVSISAAEAQRSFLAWRNILLGDSAASYGLRTGEEVYLRDYRRVGTGEVSTWRPGPLAPLGTAALPGEERDWLLASNR